MVTLEDLGANPTFVVSPAEGGRVGLTIQGEAENGALVEFRFPLDPARALWLAKALAAQASGDLPAPVPKPVSPSTSKPPTLGGRSKWAVGR